MRRVLWLLTAGCGRFAFDSGHSADAPAPDMVLPDADTSGLIARYPMDDDPATGTVLAIPAQYSGHCTTCPIRGTGRLAGGYVFDGTERIELPDALGVGLAPFSVALWFTTEPNGNLYSLVSKPLDLVSNNNVLSVTLASGAIGYETSINGTIVGFAGPLLEFGAWHSVVATWDGLNRRIYADGALGAEQPGAFDDSSLAVGLGADLDNGVPSIFFKGSLDEVRFYDRALTAAEVAAFAQ